MKIARGQKESKCSMIALTLIHCKNTARITAKKKIPAFKHNKHYFCTIFLLNIYNFIILKRKSYL